MESAKQSEVISQQMSKENLYRREAKKTPNNVKGFFTVLIMILSTNGR